MSNHLSFASRPDSSGVRGGLDRPVSKRLFNYPYDKDVSYGQPRDYDRGSGGTGPSHNPITPKDTEHSIWDDLEEIAGSPILLKKASQGGHGSAVPGASRGWATNPSKPWDESDQDRLEKFGEAIARDIELMSSLDRLKSMFTPDEIGEKELVSVSILQGLLPSDSAWETLANIIRDFDHS